MKCTVKDIAHFIGGELKGDGSIEITGISGINEARTGELTFIDSPKLKNSANRTNASCIITSFDIDGWDKPIIKCKNPLLSVIKIMNKMFPCKTERPKGIAKTASIGKNVKLGKDVAIGANSVIGDGTIIGDGTTIYPLVYIGANTKIGEKVLVYPNVTLREDVTVGNNAIIHSSSVIGADGFGFTKDGGQFIKIPQVGTVEIKDDVEVGACVTIDRATFGKTVIGKGTKIDNLVQIAHNVRIGENCIVVAQVGISGSVNVGSNVILGGQVGIADHVDIGDNVMVAAKSGITKSIPAKTIMSGIPARPHNISKRLIAHIDNLPKIVQRLDKLEKKLKELSG